MASECLPFAAIPHTTRLFTDYLRDPGRVARFFPRPPLRRDWVADEAARLQYDAARRALVAGVLERQNRAWGASAATFENIARLRAGAAAVVTGQQVGLFGGPLFAIYKALTAIRLATEATHAGTPAVPVFWLATEDHDLAEVNHATLLTGDSALVRVATASRGPEAAPMSTVVLGDEIAAVVAQATEALGRSEATDALRAAYKPGETLGSAFARLFSWLFAHSGVILLDASDPELHRVAAPLYAAAVARCSELNQALAARDQELLAAGYHAQVKVVSSHTLLFGRQNGARVPVLKTNGGFSIGGEKLSAAELQQRAERAPEAFSPNVLLRPVVQDYLLPTLAYVGGPAEVAYFAQAAVVYEKLAGRVTPVLPRFSATLVEPRIARLLERHKVALADTFAGEEEFRRVLAARNLPAGVTGAFDSAQADLERAIAAATGALEALDPTLARAGAKSAAKMRYQLARLRRKAATAELRGSEELRRHAGQLLNALHPNGHLQEREVAGISLVARYGPALLLTLFDAMQAGCADHQVIHL